MLAAELVWAGVDVAVVEMRDSRDFGGSRSGDLHSRTIERAGPVDAPPDSSIVTPVSSWVLPEGTAMQVQSFVSLDRGHEVSLWQEPVRADPHSSSSVTKSRRSRSSRSGLAGHAATAVAAHQILRPDAGDVGQS
jgi:hypothetical protein